MTPLEADARFLRRILAFLVAATIASGAMAGIATVNASPNATLTELLGSL